MLQICFPYRWHKEEHHLKLKLVYLLKIPFFSLMNFKLSLMILVIVLKSPSLTIQLLPRFGFGHRTPKQGIFDHPTLKTVYN
jgi:hypothetical protein